MTAAAIDEILAAEAFHDAGEVVALTGVSYRQLDYWVRTGRITPTVCPSGSGNARRFTARDIVPIQYAVVLIKAGFTADAALRNAQRLAEHYGKIVDIQVLFIPVPLSAAA